MDKLQMARNEINEVDKQIAALFERRMNAVRTVAEYKLERGLPIFDSSREQAVIDRNLAYISDPEYRAYYVQFLQDTMNVSKQFQRKLTEGLRVAYSGVEGAFANIAARRIFPEATAVAYGDFRAAYDAVTSGECDCAVLPIENSYAGEVGQVMDLMFKGSLYVNGVYTLRIGQNLLGVRGATIQDIKKVISHPQALEQCSKYIQAHGFDREKAVNTARAAQQVAEQGDKSVAAIASLETAELYGLDVLDHDIHEQAENTTRFAVFSRVENTGTSRKDKNRFLLMFTVKNEAGALAKAINVIGAYGFSMCSLRSRPMRGLAWQYYFYLEAEGDETSDNGQKMLRALSATCDMLKVSGNYSIDLQLKGEDEE